MAGHGFNSRAGSGLPRTVSPDSRACDNRPQSEPAVGMLESGRLESTQLVGLDLAPIVLKDSLLLRVPTDRLRRYFLAPTSLGGEGLPLPLSRRI